MWFILGFACLFIICWVVAMKIFPHTVTWKEGLVMLAVQTIIICIAFFGSIYNKGQDVVILNGEVTRKYSEKVSCSHSYTCNCITRCNGKTCTTVCSTCYEHAYDVDWVVESNVGRSVINRVDRRGLDMPPRWSIVKKGEPYSAVDTYYNYIKAAPFSIFNHAEIEAKVPIPSYPVVRDYYRINRVINHRSDFKGNINELNYLLNHSLRWLGPQKKVNLVVVLHSQGEQYSKVLKAKNLGGKINDIFIVININKEGEFKNVDVFSWSKNDLVNVTLRDSILEIGKWNPVEMDKAISKTVYKYYTPRKIEEFRYLKEEVELPLWASWFIMVFGVVFPFGSAFIAHKHEIV